MHKKVAPHNIMKTAIVGARGYSGLELARLLLQHPQAELKACFATSADWKLDDYIDAVEAARVPVLAMSELDGANFDVVFLATPPEVSAELAPKLVARGARVIDLSNAFRLKKEAHYGLVPWAGPLSSETMIIANPGCYATATLMAALPLLRDNVIVPSTLVVDAKSGATGAGRKAAENLLYTEVEGECLPYRVGRHQHLPEIIAHAQAFTGVAIDPFFTTHLLPVSRGIIASLYARLSPALVSKAPDAALKAVSDAFDRAYGGYPLITHAAGEKPAMLSLKRVARTPHTRISYVVQGDKLFAFSVIDNLMKGAASQAVENFNRLNDLSPMTGLAVEERN